MNNPHLHELARVVLRYLASALITKGAVSVELGNILADPATLEVGAGLIVFLLTERWWLKEKRAAK